MTEQDLRSIVLRAAAIYGADPERLMAGRKSCADDWKAKRLATYVMRRQGVEWRVIAKAMGGRHHSTSISNYRGARCDYQADAEFRRFCDAMIAGNRVMSAADIGIQREAKHNRIQLPAPQPVKRKRTKRKKTPVTHRERMRIASQEYRAAICEYVERRAIG